MGSNIFSASLSAMNAAQIGLATTEHNIANASTPGYNRQVVEVGARAAQQTGSGFLGQGVDVTGIKRIYDDFVASQVLHEQTQATYLSTYHSSLSQIDNMLADPLAGASPAMQQFFDAMNSLSSTPESVPARQTLLTSGQFAVGRFQAIDQRLTDIAEGLNGQITNTVSTINSYAQQIAALNGNIKRAGAIGGGSQMPNDLLDQRDNLIAQLNKEIKASVQPQSDGTVAVFIGSGQPIVVDEKAYALRVVQSQDDPSRLDVAYQSQGKLVPLQSSTLKGGNLGAFMSFRDEQLEPARNALGRVAIGLAYSMNQQNKMGVDLNGALGADLFVMPTPRVTQGAGNTGTSSVTATISDVSALTTSDYQLRYDGTNYTLARLSDNTVTSLGSSPGTFAADGFSFTITAGAVAGDTFMLRPTADGGRDIDMATSDPAKIATAAPIRGGADLTNTGTGTITAGTVNTPLPLNANLQNTVTITFTDATHYNVVDTTLGSTLASNVVYNPATGATLTYNGWTTKLAGAPVAGDEFTVVKNTNAAGDNRNGLLLAALQNQNTLAGGTASFQNAYGQLVASVGAKTNELAITSEAQNNMLKVTLDQQQSISGVNLEEEAANLLRYQRAYQAAAKAMQIANTMFESLLGLGQ